MGLYLDWCGALGWLPTTMAGGIRAGEGLGLVPGQSLRDVVPPGQSRKVPRAGLVRLVPRGRRKDGAIACGNNLRRAGRLSTSAFATGGC